MYIWWLNQLQTESTVDNSALNKLPEYIFNGLQSRIGRAGRGRLWVHESLPSTSVDPWPDTSLAETLGKDYGGIVFKPEHLEIVELFPGIITDLQLNLISCSVFN